MFLNKEHLAYLYCSQLKKLIKDARCYMFFVLVTNLK